MLNWECQNISSCQIKIYKMLTFDNEYCYCVVGSNVII